MEREKKEEKPTFNLFMSGFDDVPHPFFLFWCDSWTNLADMNNLNYSRKKDKRETEKRRRGRSGMWREK